MICSGTSKKCENTSPKLDNKSSYTERPCKLIGRLMQSIGSLGVFVYQRCQKKLSHTNVTISSYQSKFSDQQCTDLRDMDINELRALFGLLHFCAIFKSNHENLVSMFATDNTGREIFRAILVMKTVLIFLYCLRFHN